MRLMTKCPVCVTVVRKYVPDLKFNINNCKNSRSIVNQSDITYHFSRIFIFNGMKNHNVQYDSLYKSHVKSSIFIRSPSPSMNYSVRTDDEKISDLNYLNNLDVLLINRIHFDYILRLARYIQEKIDYSNTLNGFIVITIDDIDRITKKTLDSNYYTINICYYESDTNGRFASADDYKDDLTFDDFVFMTLTQPDSFSKHSFIPIVSYKAVDISSEPETIVIDEESRKKLESDKYFTDIARYAYKYILKLNKRRNDKKYKDDLANRKFCLFNTTNDY